MQYNKKILITGANGFVGKVLVRKLLDLDYNIKAVIRAKYNDISSSAENYKTFMIKESEPDLKLTNAMNSVDTVVHCAARVHVMQDTSSDPLLSFRKVNVDLTKRLVKLAVMHKVKRFIFISSLHVNGSASFLCPFNEKDSPNPSSPYAISKWEAEQYLNEIAKKTDIEIVIIRPPLVYGPGVKANFLNLLKLTKTGVPLPVGMLNVKRSMISINNLVDFIIHCIKHLKSANETFFISDDEDISTKELFSKLILLFNKHPLLLPIPSKILYALGVFLQKRKIVDRLCSPLQVDISKAKTLLGWKPVQTLDEALEETVEWYKKRCLVS